MNMNDFCACQFEQTIGPYIEKMVAVFNSTQISENEVREAITTGTAETNDNILIVSESKWVRIFRNGNPFPTDDSKET